MYERCFVCMLKSKTIIPSIDDNLFCMGNIMSIIHWSKNLNINIRETEIVAWSWLQFRLIGKQMHIKCCQLSNTNIKLTGYIQSHFFKPIECLPFVNWKINYFNGKFPKQWNKLGFSRLILKNNLFAWKTLADKKNWRASSSNRYCEPAAHMSFKYIEMRSLFMCQKST